MFALVISQKADGIAAVKSQIPEHFKMVFVQGRPRGRQALSSLTAIFLAALTVPNLAAAEAQSGVGLNLVAQGFTSPVALAPLDAASSRLLIVDQIGAIYVLTKEGQLMDRPFLDLRGRLAKLNQGFDERGLLGLALHPRFAENRRLFVGYSAPLRKDGPAEWDHTLHISEFKVSQRDPLQVDPDTERILLQIDKPYFNHNGGAVVFGLDGYLYISVGDGGNANDAKWVSRSQPQRPLAARGTRFSFA